MRRGKTLEFTIYPKHTDLPPEGTELYLQQADVRLLPPSWKEDSKVKTTYYRNPEKVKYLYTWVLKLQKVHTPHTWFRIVVFGLSKAGLGPWDAFIPIYGELILSPKTNEDTRALFIYCQFHHWVAAPRLHQAPVHVSVKNKPLIFYLSFFFLLQLENSCCPLTVIHYVCVYLYTHTQDGLQPNTVRAAPGRYGKGVASTRQQWFLYLFLLFHWITYNN